MLFSPFTQQGLDFTMKGMWERGGGGRAAREPQSAPRARERKKEQAIEGYRGRRDRDREAIGRDREEVETERRESKRKTERGRQNESKRERREEKRDREVKGRKLLDRIAMICKIFNKFIFAKALPRSLHNDSGSFFLCCKLG